MSWTTLLPKESGFYWWREEPSYEPSVVEVMLESDAVYQAGTEMPMWINPSLETDWVVHGEFWPMKLTPP